MLKNFINRYKTRQYIKKWNKSPLGQSLASHTRKYFHDNGSLSHFTEENKNKIIDDFYGKILSLCNSDNAIIEMRELIVFYVCSYADLKVLSLTETEKSEILSDCPQVSGLLYKNIKTYAKKNDELAELAWKCEDISDEELISLCKTRCNLYTYYVNGINLVRYELGDFDSEKDWLNPFIKSMLIWSETQLREKCGLPTLLNDPLEGLRHSTFMNMVTSGYKNPYFEWDKTWLPDSK